MTTANFGFAHGQDEDNSWRELLRKDLRIRSKPVVITSSDTHVTPLNATQPLLMFQTFIRRFAILIKIEEATERRITCPWHSNAAAKVQKKKIQNKFIIKDKNIKCVKWYLYKKIITSFNLKKNTYRIKHHLGLGFCPSTNDLHTRWKVVWKVQMG